MVEVNVSVNAINALKKIGVDPNLLDWLNANAVTVKLTASHWRFIKGDHSEEVPTSLTELTNVHNGTMGAGPLGVLRTVLENAIFNLKKKIEPSHEGASAPNPIEQAIADEVVKPEPEPEVVTGHSSKLFPNVNVKPKTLADDGAMALLPPLVEAVAVDKPVVSEKAADGAFDTFDVAYRLSSPCVALASASRLYQPVHGTSPGSRYWLVGANEDIRVAARYMGGELSLRIEGPSWAKYESNITKIGFNKIDKKKGYASVHLTVGHDELLASKTLGAVLMGLGIQFKTLPPQLKYVKA